MYKHPEKYQQTFAVDQSSGSTGEVDGGSPSDRDDMAAAVAEFGEHRAAIERTKGMLMLVYGIDEAAAFELLRWRSMENNVKLRSLAEQMAADFLNLTRLEPDPRRSAYDQILLSAHLRIEGQTPSRDGVALSSADEDILGVKTGRAIP
jgi:ANTAR domain